MPKAARESTPPQIPRLRERSVKQITGRLVLVRQWLGLSQAGMATRLGISVRAYREYELGRRKWKSMAFSLRVSGATNVSIDWRCFGGYWGRPLSRVPLAVDGRPMRPVLRVMSDQEEPQS